MSKEPTAGRYPYRREREPLEEEGRGLCVVVVK
jgi:hypothetical protein